MESGVCGVMHVWQVVCGRGEGEIGEGRMCSWFGIVVVMGRGWW